MIKDTSDSTLADDIGTEGIVLVWFTAEWCAPCKMLKPVLEGLENHMYINILKLDIDKNPVATEQYDVQSVPSLVLFQDGAKVRQDTGAFPTAILVERYSPYL